MRSSLLARNHQRQRSAARQLRRARRRGVVVSSPHRDPLMHMSSPHEGLSGASDSTPAPAAGDSLARTSLRGDDSVWWGQVQVAPVQPVSEASTGGDAPFFYAPAASVNAPPWLQASQESQLPSPPPSVVEPQSSMLSSLHRSVGTSMATGWEEEGDSDVGDGAHTGAASDADPPTVTPVQFRFAQAVFRDHGFGSDTPTATTQGDSVTTAGGNRLPRRKSATGNRRPRRRSKTRRRKSASATRRARSRHSTQAHQGGGTWWNSRQRPGALPWSHAPLKAPVVSTRDSVGGDACTVEALPQPRRLPSLHTSSAAQSAPSVLGFAQPLPQSPLVTTPIASGSVHTAATADAPATSEPSAASSVKGKLNGKGKMKPSQRKPKTAKSRRRRHRRSRTRSRTRSRSKHRAGCGKRRGKRRGRHTKPRRRARPLSKEPPHAQPAAVPSHPIIAMLHSRGLLPDALAGRYGDPSSLGTPTPTLSTGSRLMAGSLSASTWSDHSMPRTNVRGRALPPSVRKMLKPPRRPKKKVWRRPHKLGEHAGAQGSRTPTYRFKPWAVGDRATALSFLSTKGLTMASVKTRDRKSVAVCTRFQALWRGFRVRVAFAFLR